MHSKLRKYAAVLLIFSLLSLFAVSEAAAFGVGSRGPDVYAVQAMLKSLGYHAGSIDGQYGPQTANSVRLFQKAYGLPQTGAVDGRTLQSILWAYGNLKIPKEKAPPAPKQPPAPDKAAIPKLSAEEQLMVNLVNGERKQNKLPPLSADLELSRVARIKSQEMVVKQYFSHTSPTYGSPFEMMKAFGISYRTAGENIACNQDVNAAHKALMASEGHRKNILNPSFTHIGIGIANGGQCGKMFTQMFIGK